MKKRSHFGRQTELVIFVQYTVRLRRPCLMDDVPLPPPPSNLKDIKPRLKIRLCVSKVLTDCFHNPIAYRQSFAGFTLALTPEQK